MKIERTRIDGVIVVETAPLVDHRGAFTRLFCARELAPIIEDRRLVQINSSRTHSIGTVRGLHYQHPPHAELKLVHCLSGQVWDVAVDLRAGSPTFLQWHGERLSAEYQRMLVVPEGCAHGFQALEPGSELLYMHTAFFESAAEGGIRYDEPRIGIDWPLPVSAVSDRDSRHPYLEQAFAGIVT